MLQNFFVLLNSQLIETPENLQKASQCLFEVYQNVLREQFYLQDLGVSFSYTDTIDQYSRRDLLDIADEIVEARNKNLS